LFFSASWIRTIVDENKELVILGGVDLLGVRSFAVFVKQACA
jgi:hypothetical protein